MKDFKLTIPADIADASEKATQPGVRILAGGTDILGTIIDDIHKDSVSELVNIKKLGYDYIREEEGGVAIGATVKLSEVEKRPLIKKQWKLIADAAATVASPQIRNMATIGGNICQEPRCWYYRYPDNKFDCLRKGGTICPAFTGNNVYHSILGSVHVCETGCRCGCPNDTEIAQYMELIRQGDTEAAAKVLFSVNPLSAVTGRICPHTCMDDCSRSDFDDSVAIRNVERFLGDYILDHADRFFEMPQDESDKTVAVVGAGPAGLTAAYYLRSQGFAVSVFDVHDEIGGMLRYAIPAYRLPREILVKTKAALEQMGIRFVLGDDCDRVATVETYKRSFDAVYIGNGAQKSQKAGFEGEEKCLSGIEFLYNISVDHQDKPGDDVLVIGGGDVAMDVAVSAKRLGAKNVTFVYRRPKALMPAHEEELQVALEEGVEIADSLTPVGVVTEGGKITGLDVAVTRSGSSRSSKPEIDLEDRKILKTDCVILAIGQSIDDSPYGASLKRDRKNRIQIGVDFQTSLPGIYAGGDAVLGPATIIEAIAQARNAAVSIAKYLVGGSKFAFSDYTDRAVGSDATTFDSSAQENSDPSKLISLPNGKGTLLDEDIPGGLNEDGVLAEAKRCFNCGCVAVSASDIAPALIALSAVIRTTEREIPAADFFAAKVGSTTVLHSGEIVKDIFLPSQEEGAYTEYKKFRPRKTIDFPVLSVAVKIASENGSVTNAKIVIGAAGPVPLEAISAEDYLTGKKIDGDVAEAAATLVVESAVPLAENAYKISIAKALVRRAVLAAEPK